MTSKQQIKDLVTAELLNSPMYQIVLTVKQLIIDEIARPNVQRKILYKYDNPISRADVEVLKMCLLLEFGFLTNEITDTNLAIDMVKFLE